MRTEVTNATYINEDQMSIKVLCVCEYNLIRSPTFATLIAQEGFNTRSAGINEHAVCQIDAYVTQWADVIVVLDELVFNKLADHPHRDKMLLVKTVIGNNYMDMRMRDYFHHNEDDIISNVYKIAEQTRSKQ